MIPIMLEEGYKANGWLGLVLGTRLWYPLYGADDGDEVFENAVDAIAREIGDRGRRRQAEPQAQQHEQVQQHEQEPQLQPHVQQTSSTPFAPFPTPAPAPMMAATPDRGGYSPSIHASSPQTLATSGSLPTVLSSSGGGANLAEFAGFLQLFKQHQEDTVASHRTAEDALDAKIEQKLLLASATAAAAAAAAPQEASMAEQVQAVQARLEQMHEQGLLADEVLFALEDLVADVVEARASSLDTVITKQMLHAWTDDVRQRLASAAKLHQPVELGEAVQTDAAFARQIKRKFAVS